MTSDLTCTLGLVPVAVTPSQETVEEILHLFLDARVEVEVRALEGPMYILAAERAGHVERPAPG